MVLPRLTHFNTDRECLHQSEKQCHLEDGNVTLVLIDTPDILINITNINLTLTEPSIRINVKCTVILRTILIITGQMNICFVGFVRLWGEREDF